MPENILLIQADATDAQSVREALEHSDDRTFKVEWVTTCAIGLQCLIYLGKQQVERPTGIRAVLIDLRLPDFTGIQSFDRLIAAMPDIPILVLASEQDEALAKLAVQRGATDYLFKSHAANDALAKTVVNMIDRTTEIGQLREQRDGARRMLDSLGDAVIGTDPNNRVMYLNAVAERLTGWSKGDALGRLFEEVMQVINSETRAGVKNPLSRVTQHGKLAGLPPSSSLLRRDGTEIAIADSCALIRDSENHVTGAVMVFRDVSAARADAQRYAYLAQHDSLTDLPNRTLLADRLSQAIVMAHRHRTTFAVLFLDLDRFKHINDSLGHWAADRLLQSVARRLQGCVRASDTVSRQGGDEFVILLPDAGQPQDAAFCAEKLIQAVKLPYMIDENEIFVSASIGIALFPNDGDDANRLLENADSAMYEAKERGRGGYQFYRTEINSSAVARQSLENGLRHAIQRREFEVHYQPIMQIKTGKVSGVEALIRWRRPGFGVVPPNQFIPAAEESGLIVPIGQWMLGEACRQAKAWHKAGASHLRLAVNISTVEMRSRDFVAGVEGILDETGFDAGSLDLELTETFLMHDAESTEIAFRALKAVGVQFALDDFGTGYSSLSYMRRFPINALKVDQSFVRDLTTDPHDASVVCAVINMGRSLHMRVVAEGVETQGQLDFLKHNGCSEAQGYYFSRPLSAGGIADYLQRSIAELS